MSILFTHFLIFSARFLLVHKNKVFIKDFFSKCDQILEILADLVTFTKTIFNGKFRFLSSV